MLVFGEKQLPIIERRHNPDSVPLKPKGDPFLATVVVLEFQGHLVESPKALR